MDYAWDFGDANTSIDQNPTHLYATAGTYTVTLTVTDTVNGCFDTHAVTVKVFDELQLNASSTAATCPGGSDGSISISVPNGTAPYSYSLNNGAPQSGGNFTGLTAGTFNISVVDANGCSANLSISVNEPAALGFTSNVLTNVNCVDDLTGSVTVNANGGTAPYLYAIDGGSNFTSGAFNSLSGGNHNVTITDGNGCTFTDVVTITVLTPAPSAFFNATANGLEIDFVNLSQNVDTYSWYFGDGSTSSSENPTHTYSTNGAYTVTLIVSNECGSDTIKIDLGGLVGIGDEENSFVFNLYPNPNNGQFFINLESAENLSDLNLRVWSVEGRLISDEAFNISGNTFTHQINQNLSAGVYVIELISEKQTFRDRVVVR
jgi:hypothetical protein